MNKKLIVSIISIVTLILFVLGTAEAKRFGGGFSFGGKKSYSSPYKQRSYQQKSFSQQKAAAANQQRKQQFSKRGGFMGMLGGLALGGLLGSLFFGGAFEGFNFFDFIMIGGVILLIMWLMQRKTGASRSRPATAGGYTPGPGPGPASSSAPPSNFNLEKQDASFSQSFAEKFGMGNNAHNNSQQYNNGDADMNNEIILPQWFDQDEFLNSARSAYTLLQEAWDKGDLEAIKGLTTDTVYAEITRQFTQQANQTNTRILKLDAQLIDFNELSDHTEAAVMFDAVLSENDAETQGRATQVKELWHFIRSTHSTEPTWYLDGIQQLD